MTQLFSDYVIVPAGDTAELRKAVDDFFAMGFVCIGGVSVVMTDAGMYLYQAMARPITP